MQDAYSRLAKAFRLEDLTDCEGMPPWSVVVFKDTERWTSLQLHTLFQQEMIRHGILFSGSQFISLAHDEGDIERTIVAYGEAFKVLRSALDENCVHEFILGEVNQPVFQRVF